MITVQEFKYKLISSGIFKRVSNGQYRIKTCPKCGDMKWHCYVKIDVNDDSPILFNCFKCGCGGVVNKDFLDYLGLDDISNDMPIGSFSKKLNMNNNVSTKIPEDIINFDNDNIDGVVNYIKQRVGVDNVSIDDLKAFRVVGNPKQYATDYLGAGNINSINNRYWFQMTNGNIIGRWFDDSIEMRWLKYKSDRIRSSGLYKISSAIDLYSNINICLCEGVMDAIGLYYNYDGCMNNLYIACLGKSYMRGIKYVIDKGIFGNGVNVKIFKDNDYSVNDIKLDYHYSKLFKRIDIYENMLSKDYGVSKDLYDIHKIIIR